MLVQFKTEGPPLTYSVASLASIPGSLGSEWLCFVQEPGWVKQWHVDSGKTSDMLVSCSLKMSSSLLWLLWILVGKLSCICLSNRNSA